MGWDLLIRQWGLPKEKMWITIYLEDDEAFHLWRKIGIPEDRIVRLGEKDNFWAMGETGPCGPCSEIITIREKGSAAAVRIAVWDVTATASWNSGTLSLCNLTGIQKESFIPWPSPVSTRGWGLNGSQPFFKESEVITTQTSFAPLFRKSKPSAALPMEKILVPISPSG
jgi:hypothetical protein